MLGAALKPTKRHNIVSEQDAHGVRRFLPGAKECHAQGARLDGVVDNIKAAVELYLEPLSAEEQSSD